MQILIEKEYFYASSKGTDPIDYFRKHGAVTLSVTSLHKEIFYQGSNESSASTHVCILPSRYSVVYSRGLSIAKAFKAHSS